MTSSPVASTARAPRTTRPTFSSRLLAIGCLLGCLLPLPSGQEIGELAIGGAVRGGPVADEAEAARRQEGDAVADVPGQGEVVGDHHLGDVEVAVEVADQVADRGRGR